MALLPSLPKPPGEHGDKVQHLIAFFVLGVLAASGWRQTPALALIALLLGVGAAIELFQLIPWLGRDAGLLDWLADGIAAVVAIAVTRAFLPRL